MDRVRELVWPATAVVKRSGLCMFVYGDGQTAERLVRGGIAWPRIVGPVQRAGYLVTCAMEAREDKDACRIEGFVHGPFAAVTPVIDGGRVTRPGLSSLVSEAAFRCGAAEFWCDSDDAAARFWRREVRQAPSVEVRLRNALNFGSDAAAHLLWQIEASGRLTIPPDLGAAMAEHDVVDQGRSGKIDENPPRFALALALQALVHAHDREGFFSVKW